MPFDLIPAAKAGYQCHTVPDSGVMQHMRRIDIVLWCTIPYRYISGSLRRLFPLPHIPSAFQQREGPVTPPGFFSIYQPHWHMPLPVPLQENDPLQP